MNVKYVFAVVCLFVSMAGAQTRPEWREWNQPVEPFRIIGNIYYVGASDITSFLIASPKGHILLDGGFAETAPQIRDNIRKLGFKVEDVKYLLLTQSHFDHAAGLAALKRWSGAKFVASREDGGQVARGGKGDFQWGDEVSFEPVTTDQFIQDGDTLELGGNRMVARITPGHTKGCTTWTTVAEEKGKRYNVVFLCSTTAPGYNLVGNREYPTIIEDFRKTFQLLHSMSCDVMLGAHGSFFQLNKKRELLAKSKTNPFVDRQELSAFVQKSKVEFEAEVKRQQQK
ncbi:MAG TPA: subclass B3 metallo-beta-lactamase [Terriglobales bacterium]|nr:subclass B3 metallo-beta-lactamase [Terriglobales bacterium]